jgi:hypothetical protein
LIADSANAFAAGDLNKYFKVTLNTSGTSNLKIVENDDDKVVTDITPSVVTSDKIQVVDSAARVIWLIFLDPLRNACRIRTAAAQFVMQFSKKQFIFFVSRCKIILFLFCE